MPKRVYRFWSVLIILSVIWSCANRGRPSGGEIDELPPEIINSKPENFSTNFNSDEIVISFNEFIKIKNLQKQLIISPPMKYEPEISPQGAASRYIKIKIKDTLPPNTTYAFNFGNSIVDNNEDNPYPYFRYVFSTGSTIDSLSVQGVVLDAVEKEAESYISVMLYEKDSTYTDSLVFKSRPRYITNTLDSLKIFSIDNIKAGTYKLIALKDESSNYTFDPKNDKIGYIEEFIEVPKDTLYQIKLFKEELDFEIKRPKHVGVNRIMFPYQGELKQFKIDVLEGKPEGFESRILKDEKTDSLYYWYKPKFELDSTFFRIETSKAIDTVQLRFRKVEKDSLMVSAYKTGNLNFGEDFTLTGTTPLSKLDPTLIKIINKDSLPVDFSVKKDTLMNRYALPIDLNEDENYKILMLPGAITDFFGSTNDTLNFSVKTKNKSSYGNLRVTLVNGTLPMIAQLVSTSGEVKYEVIASEANIVDFTNVIPIVYSLRVIFDSNNNGRWDSGNFLKNLQPERISYYNEDIEMRANFDNIYEFILLSENDPGPTKN